MNLVIFSQFFYPHSGGAYTFLKNMVDNLEPNEYKNIYVVSRRKNFKYFESCSQKIILVPNTMPGPNAISYILFVVFSLRKIKALYDKNAKKNIIWNPFNWGIFTKLEGFDIITTIHDLYNFTYPEDKNIIKRLINNFLVRQTIKSSDKIITVSKFTKQEIYVHLREFIKNKPIEVIYESYKPHVINSINKRIYLSNYLFTVSTYRKQKNLDFLFYVLNNLIEKYNYTGVLLVGGKIPDKKLKALVDKCERLGIKNKVKFLGYVKDEELENYYKNCDCFVFPSYYEGFGLPVVEADFYGAKICTSDAASLNEFNTTNKKANPFDIQEFSRVLIQTIEDERSPIDYNITWKQSATKMSLFFYN